jgi:NADH-quinone oxidoreductase subunit N
MTPDFSALSLVNRAEIAMVAGILVLLVLAPRIDRSRMIPAVIGLVAAGVAFGFGVQAHGTEQFALLVVPPVVAFGMLLLSSAELFDRHQSPEAAALLLVGGVGGVVLIDGQSLLEMALGVEMISLVGAALVALGQGRRPLEAGFKYFVLTAVTFATLLFGMGLCFLATGSLAIPALGAVGASVLPFASLGVAMFAVGLCFKLAVLPVHMGALDAYTAGPSSFVGFIMVVSKVGAAVALARLVSGAGDVLALPLLLVGIATIGFAVTASFAQGDLRRLLAYSAVAHAGFIAVGAGSENGGQVAGFYVVSYGVAALLAFACLAGTGTGNLSLNALRPGGTLQLGPARAIGLMVALLSMAGVPPLPGFWGKLAVLKACYVSFGAAPTALVALGGVVGIIYYLRPLPDLLAQARETKGQGTIESLVAVGVAIAAVVVLSVAPQLAWNLAR